VATGLYSFNLFDVVSKSSHPFTTAVIASTGLAQHVRDIGPVHLYLVGTIGVASGGTNTGWAWTSGGVAVIPLRGGFSLMPCIRVLNSGVLAQGQAPQFMVGLAIGWKL
jgi:hypothetical protein